MFYKLKSKLLTILGDIRYFGWKNPFWFALNVPSFKLRGEHYRSLKLVIQPGDILLRGFEGYVDGWFIPGHWSHAGLYVGGEKEQVVHSMAEGVFIEDVLNFLRTDRVAVFRPPADMVCDALKRVLLVVNTILNLILLIIIVFIALKSSITVILAC